ncbi:MAG: hypothetical protein IKV85_08840 [Ruminococcus sp.]|nr:hypothetical protein [Ruminococcus sp.]
MNINDYKKVTDRLSPSAECRNEVLNMKKKQRKNIKLSRKGFAAIIAVAVAACGGTAVYAAEKLGAFDRVNKTLEEKIILSDGTELEKDKFAELDYNQIAQTAQTFTKPISFVGEDVSITIESVYCDGYTVILGLTGSLNNGNPEDYEYIPFRPVIKVNDKVYSDDFNISKGVLMAKGKLYLEKGTENSFAGQFQFTFDEKHKIAEPVDITFSLKEFIPNSEIYGSVYENMPKLKDEFSVCFNVSPDESLTRHINHTFTDSEGYSVTIFDISPVAMLEQCFNSAEEMAERNPYVKNHSNSKVFALYTDGNGKELEVIGMHHPLYREDGTLASFRQPPTSDTINIKYYDANHPDENGEPTFIHEMTIDLKNLTVIE